VISEHWIPLGCWFSISVKNLAEKCWSTPKLRPKIEIQDGGRPPSWNWCIIIYDHPRSLFIGPHWPVKFYANPMHSFEDMTTWIFFCWFGLKFLFTSPKFRFLGVWTAKRDWSSSRTPKGTSLAGTALTWRFWCRSSWLTTWARDEETKKGKERNLQWQTGCSPRPPTLTKRHVVLHAGWSLGGSYKFQVSSKSVERFSRCGVEICHFLYLRPVAYITTSTTVQAMIVQRPT